MFQAKWILVQGSWAATVDSTEVQVGDVINVTKARGAAKQRRVVSIHSRTGSQTVVRTEAVRAPRKPRSRAAAPVRFYDDPEVRMAEVEAQEARRDAYKDALAGYYDARKTAKQNLLNDVRIDGSAHVPTNDSLALSLRAQLAMRACYTYGAPELGWEAQCAFEADTRNLASQGPTCDVDVRAAHAQGCEWDELLDGGYDWAAHCERNDEMRAERGHL